MYSTLYCRKVIHAANLHQCVMRYDEHLIIYTTQVRESSV